MKTTNDQIVYMIKKRHFPYSILCTQIKTRCFFSSYFYIRKSKLLILECSENYYLYVNIPYHKYYYMRKCKSIGRYFNRSIKPIATECIIIPKMIHSKDFLEYLN